MSEGWGKKFVKKAESAWPLGEGAEKKVYPHPDPEKADKQVVAVFHPGGVKLDRYYFDAHPEMDGSEQNFYKQQFYLIKILHLLFPKNIPDIHLVATEPRFMIRERVETRKKTGSEEFKSLKLNPKQLLWDKPKLVNELRSIGLAVDDAHDGNYLPTKSGGVAYPDTFFLVATNSTSDQAKEKLFKQLKSSSEIGDNLERIIDKKLQGEEKQDALVHLSRYRALVSQRTNE